MIKFNFFSENHFRLSKFMLSFVLVFSLSELVTGQSIPSSAGSTNCHTCAPNAGWTVNLGTPDVSNNTTAATNGTFNGGTSWINQPLPLPPNGHTHWISLRDLGPANTEEIVGTTMTGLIIGELYEIQVFSLTAVADYSPVYNDAFRFRVGSLPIVEVSPITQDTWGISRLRFVADATTMSFELFPGKNSGGSPTTFESVQISVTLNAIKLVGDDDNDGVGNDADLDDDDDGILDENECSFTKFNPTDLISPPGSNVTGINIVNQDISSLYNLPSGSLFVSITNGATGSSGNSWIINTTTGNTEFVFSGPYADLAFMRVAHDNNLDSNTDKGFISNDNKHFALTTPSLTNDFVETTAGYSYGVLNPAGGVITTNATRFQWEATSAGAKELEVFSTGTGNNEYFIELRVCDTDRDQVLDHLDLDSDNDGCPDAIEADEGVTIGQLDVNNRIDIINQGGVDVDGVPNLVNTGGVADGTNNDQGQGETGNEVTAVTASVDATALVNQSLASLSSTSFTITSVTATSTSDYSGTAPTTTPNYTGPSATDVSGTLVYQWQEDGVNLSNTGVYSGTNTSTLNISNVTGLDGKVYNLIVTHPNNSCINIQNSATLTVFPPIVSVTDPVTGVNGLDGSTGVTNVLTNDTLNGVAVVPADVTLTETVADPNGYLTLNADGSVDVGANTPAGTYQLTYQICENLNPTNCSSTTVDVTVDPAPIVSVTDPVTGVNGLDGSTGVTNVLTNDTLNGVAVVPADVTLTETVADPNGYLTLNADGSVDVGANTPAGTYQLTYQICENLNPTNCSSTTVDVTVDPAPIVSVTDPVTGVNGLDGSTGVTNVLTNDTLNGVAVVPADVTLTETVADPNGYLTLNADGSVDVGANTPAGTYQLTYQICENLNPTNCSSTTVDVTVDPAPIVSVTDPVTGVNGLDGSTGVTNVLTNDTLNGVAVVPADVTLTETVADPNGYLTLNADGSVDVGANTPAGTYQLTYQICENLNPTNCSSTTVDVTVDLAPIVSVTDPVTGVNGLDGSTGVTNVLTNDTLNGVAVVPADVTLTETVADPNGYLTLNADGSVDVGANTPAGTYQLTYQICENLNPTNCSSTTVDVTVDPAPIVSVTDPVTGVNGLDGSTGVTNVLTNDTLNGVAVVPADVTLTETVADPNGYLTLNADGSVDVGANTPAGTYQLTYQICENLNPTNCSSTTVDVTVDPAPIVSVTDPVTGVNGLDGSTGVTNVLTNDTLNGVAVVPADITLTETVADPNGYLTLNADGSVDVGANTPAGTYQLTYQICENLNPTNCSSTTVDVTVDPAPIVSVTDPVTGVNGLDGSTGVTNVLTNDTLNGVAVVPADVTLTETVADPNGYLTLNADGSVDVGANTPAGTYQLTYQICENLNPTNCSSTTVDVVVVAPAIDAVTDTTPAIDGLPGGTTGALTDNDTINGNPVTVGTNPGDVTIAGVSVPAGLTLNPDGTVTIAPNTPAGNYTVEYTICEVNNPTNCDTVSSIVTVSAPTIDAVSDTTPAIDGLPGGTTGALTDNDTINGNPVRVGTNPGDLAITGVSVPAGLTLNPDGTVTIAPNTSAGDYTVEYTICEVNNPTNCDTVSSIVTVSAPVIEAVTDTTPEVNGLSGGTTGALTDNDTINGNPVTVGTNPGDVTITGVSVPAGLTLNPDGTVTIAPNTPAGTYDLEYTICEVNNPTNCSTVTSQVVVVGAPIVAVNDLNPDNLSNVNGALGGIAGDVTENDTLNGNLVDDSNITITIDNNGGLTGLSIDSEGNLIVPAGTEAGTYEVIYQICENLNPDNCSTGTATVVVDPDNDADGIIDSIDVDDDNDGIPDSAEGTGDTDGDGIPDSLDLDSDNDGILDVDEGGNGDLDTNGDGVIDSNDTGYVDSDNDGQADDSVDTDEEPDTDGDGVPDYQDLDSDNDGINDVIENGNGDLDTNNDGVIDSNDTGGSDSDEDGISDSVDSDSSNFGEGNGGEGDTVDTDGDGVPDYQDLDSDDDGINDITEGGNDDEDGNGLVDGPDSDGDGILDEVDEDDSGFGDAGNTDVNDTDPTDPNSGGTGVVPDSGTDSDGDGISDSVDGDDTAFGDFIDTDGDGIPDNIDVDDDNDGIPDSAEGTGDTDGDGIPDSLDLDSDNDGILDVDEGGNGDLDTNGDGVIDSNDTGYVDSDNDGQADGSVDTDEEPDTDGDGVPDYQDLDSDNDGINDVIENGNGDLDTNNDGVIDSNDTGGSDSDEDGISDSVDSDSSNFGEGNGGEGDTVDTDGDGVPDYQDLDSDDDGINDITEGGNDDEDGNGVIDGPDSDGDGISDEVDEDDSGFGDTGNTDVNDTDPTDPNSGGTGVVPDSGTDSDGDGISDSVDGDDTGFGDFTDTDGDGIPDNIDVDDDNDGIPDSAEGTGDTDGDGIPDSLDLDSDNDGILDVDEGGNGDLDTNGDGVIDSNDTGYVDSDNDGQADDSVDTEEEPDTDGDGVPDYQDLDSDNDGINDVIENGNGDLDTNNDGVIDSNDTGGSDSDEDGISDSVDSDSSNFGEGNGGEGDTVDTDGDGVPDYQDLDSDDDGINDIKEGGNDDEDGNGIVDGPDSDGDGILDEVDEDDSGFGDTGNTDVNDTDPTDPNSGGTGVLPDSGTDSDGDGISDSADINNAVFGDAVGVDDCVTVYNEFTPNDDGSNDTLIINCIENYPNNTLEIFNRWGNLVYTRERYENTWNGKSEGRLNIKEKDELPSGTYYYVLDLGNGSKPRVGWVYINRD
ncbi:gliding motility-associated C-terminal domain-containing protein [Tenacibaculum sp. nBUS_03]|uniref:T9SS type B sorting domain-containing protein n=1 Tax=Tenacibaculum sp. nBUS_03 TaxID=3395320 RepID=UPI003EB777EA